MAVTDVATGLPDVELTPGCTITVDSGNASAIVTLVNVYGSSAAPTEEEAVTGFVPLFVYGIPTG